MMQGARMQQLRQRVIASYHLGPLDKDETQTYIEHRLKHVGWTGDPEFDAGCFEHIHQLSGGIPRRINTLCDRLLLASFLVERHKVDVADVEAIGRELREELGPEGRSIVASGSGRSGRAELKDATPMNGMDLQAQFRRLENRIDRLDRTVGAAVDLLQAFLHSENADKPGTSAER